MGRRRRESGFVLITMAASAVALMGVLGLAVDVGRLFVAKNETQAFCDAAALAAGLRINGDSTGITLAKAAATSTGNQWNMNTTAINTGNALTDANGGYQIDFATSIAGPWVATPATPAGYTFTRVQVTVPVNLYFIEIVLPFGSTFYKQTVAASAISGQVTVTDFGSHGLAPFSAVSTNTDPTQNFGLVVGQEYDIQWPNVNGSLGSGKCQVGAAENCFVTAPTCAGDYANNEASMNAMVNYWGSASISGYWGSTSASAVTQEVLDLLQLQAVSVNSMISMTTGNKSTVRNALDTRVNEDLDVTDLGDSRASLISYDSNTHNGRRLIGIPIVNPGGSTGTAGVAQVSGYGAFLLISDGTSPSSFYQKYTGNNGYCATYAGPYDPGSIDACIDCTGSAFKVALVQ
jgi:Flp pilus assembly protein TadG